MIVEYRKYRIVLGKLPEYLAMFEKEAAPVQREILGDLVAAYTTEIGDQPQVHHFWAYDDFASYERRRAALIADTRQRAYSAKAKPLVHDISVRILRPTSYGTPKARVD